MTILKKKISGTIQTIISRGNINMLAIDASGCPIWIKDSKLNKFKHKLNVGDNITMNGFYAKPSNIDKTIYWCTGIV